MSLPKAPIDPPQLEELIATLPSGDDGDTAWHDDVLGEAKAEAAAEPVASTAAAAAGPARVAARRSRWPWVLAAAAVAAAAIISVAVLRPRAEPLGDRSLFDYANQVRRLFAQWAMGLDERNAWSPKYALLENEAG
jgi:hypothetical protein